MVELTEKLQQLVTLLGYDSVVGSVKSQLFQMVVTDDNDRTIVIVNFTRREIKLVMTNLEHVLKTIPFNLIELGLKGNQPSSILNEIEELLK